MQNELKTTTSRPTAKLLRLGSVLAPEGPIPVSRSTWWAGIASGRFPAPLKLGPRMSVWRAEDISNLLQRIERGEV